MASQNYKRQTSHLPAISAAVAVLASPLAFIKISPAKENYNTPEVPQSLIVKPVKYKIPWSNNISPDNFTPKYETYTLKKGDNFTKLARLFRTNPELIKSINSGSYTDPDLITAGSSIFIPPVRDIGCTDGQWKGQIFNLDLSKEQDWIYLAQHLVCGNEASSTTREAMACATQHMRSDLRRAFISKLSQTLLDISNEYIYFTQDNLNKIAQPQWPDPINSLNYRIKAALYSWALDASIQQRYNGCFQGEDAVREVNPHPFRISPSALIASTESLRKIGFINTAVFKMPEEAAQESISSITQFPLIDSSTKSAAYVLMNFGVGDHNGAFCTANTIMEASKKSGVPVVYIESYNNQDMLQQSQKIAQDAGRLPASIILGGHGERTTNGCRLQVGYQDWVMQDSTQSIFWISSREDSKSIATLSQRGILFLSCDSGADIKGGINFVDATARHVKPKAHSFSIFGLNKPSNIHDITINKDGSLNPTIGENNQDKYVRIIKASK